MKLIIFLLLSTLPRIAIYGDIVDEITLLIRDGDAKELSKHFSGTVSLTIISNENLYSKVQAEIVLRDFFHKNNPSGIKLIHRLDGNPNYRHVVLNLTTGEGTFRVSVSLKSIAEVYQITEIRIEPASRFVAKN
ncbi:protein of unknown function [bacterium A37T11]|nr:protein of unknown function [bacterium A37T11]